jgi:DNA-binding response OmpR family regulator
MLRLPRIVIADRSQLAANLYRLLLAEQAPSLIVRRRFEDASALFFGRELVHLGIFNTNTFGKKLETIVGRLRDEQQLRTPPKIVLASEGEIADGHGERFAGLANATILPRPFHPDEFKSLVARLLGGPTA